MRHFFYQCSISATLDSSVTSGSNYDMTHGITDFMYGHIIADHFHVLGPLGKGSFGEVRAGEQKDKKKLHSIFTIDRILFGILGVIIGTNIEIAIKFEPWKPMPTVQKEFMFYSRLGAVGRYILGSVTKVPEY